MGFSQIVVLLLRQYSCGLISLYTWKSCAGNSCWSFCNVKFNMHFSHRIACQRILFLCKNIGWWSAVPFPWPENQRKENCLFFVNSIANDGNLLWHHCVLTFYLEILDHFWKVGHPQWTEFCYPVRELDLVVLPDAGLHEEVFVLGLNIVVLGFSE